MEVTIYFRPPLYYLPFTYFFPVSCVQAWYYFTHQRDTWPIKLLVRYTVFFRTCDHLDWPIIYHRLAPSCSLIQSTKLWSRTPVWIYPSTSLSHWCPLYISLYVHYHKLGKFCRAWKTCLVCTSSVVPILTFLIIISLPRSMLVSHRMNLWS